MKPWLVVVASVAPMLFVAQTVSAEGTLDKKLAPRIAEIVQWAASPVIVGAVVAQNRSLPAGYSGMSEPSWVALDPHEPFVVAFTINAAGKFLRTVRHPAVAEAFLNDAAGRKVAFLGKPTSWQHQGKAKHDQPMAGKIWQGPIEMDESSGTKQVQIAVPVFDEGKPVGSLVVGINIFEIARE